MICSVSAFKSSLDLPPRRKSGIESAFIRVYPWLKLSDTSFEAHAQQLLRFHREFHRQFLEDFLAETVDDHVHGVLSRDAALVAIENLVLANLRRGRLVLDARGLVLHFDIRERVRATLVADEQRIALREVARVRRAWTDLHQAAIAVLPVPGGDAFRDDGAVRVFADVHHL